MVRRSFKDILKQPANGVVYEPIPDEISDIDPDFTEDDAQQLFDTEILRKKNNVKILLNKHEGMPQ